MYSIEGKIHHPLALLAGGTETRRKTEESLLRVLLRASSEAGASSERSERVVNTSIEALPTT
jgi:hypothetical protein